MNDLLATLPDDIEKTVNKCGMCWPDDTESRIRVLGAIAESCLWWRNRHDEESGGVRRERMYKHLNKRLQATTRKLHNVRRAAVEYRTGQNFDEYSKRFNGG